MSQRPPGELTQTLLRGVMPYGEAQGTSQDGDRVARQHRAALFILLRKAAACVPESEMHPARSAEYHD